MEVMEEGDWKKCNSKVWIIVFLMLLKTQKQAEHLLIISFTWTSGIVPNTDKETGSSYNYASVRDRNAISASIYRFSKTPKSMEHRPTWSSVLFSMTSTCLDICKTGSIHLGRIHVELYRISCRSMFHCLWRPRKPMSRRRNCISNAYRRIVITTSGFVVAMHPYR